MTFRDNLRRFFRRAGETEREKSESGGGERLVLDTNVFIAAGFRPGSASAKLVEMAREGRVKAVWHRDTRGENEHIVRKIRRLPQGLLEGVFWPENEFQGALDESEFDFIEDPADRKFAALAVSADAVLVSTDQHLLRWRDRLEARVLRPGEWGENFGF